MARRGKPSGHQLSLLAESELQIEAEDALAANAVWYYSRVMCQLALPSSNYEGREFVRDSGVFHLIVQALPPLSVPWGIYPRGILNWVVTEIVRRKKTNPSRVLELGTSLAEFMAKVSGTKSYSGGEFGNIRPFKRQLDQLFSSRIAFWIGEGDRPDVTLTPLASMQISSGWNLMWHNRLPNQKGLFTSTVQISEEFFQDCLQHAVPIDVRVIRGLWPNCMAFDIYVWLTYRSYTLLRARRWSLDLSWPALKLQFGYQYATLKKFRQNFLTALARVKLLYQSMEFTEHPGQGITFRFKRPSILSVRVPELPASTGSPH